jgi:fructose transport system substrate-binding protein
LKRTLRTLVASTTAVAALGLASGAMAQATSACLITKTDTNPFFVKMKEGATAKAAELGIELKTFAGKVDGDHETQVQAIETCIADGAKGILIAASDTSSIVPAVQQARDAGLVVIALDTPLEPIDAADATFATDNFLAGLLIGQWARAKMGDDAANARIATLDLSISQPTVDVLRNQGFLQGFGVDLADPNVIGDETDPRLVGSDVTQGNEEGGRRAMENLLAAGPDDQRRPHDQRARRRRRLRGAQGHRARERRPDRLGRRRLPRRAERGGRRDRRDLAAVPAAHGVARDRGDREVGAEGVKPEPTPGKDFFDTGVALVTDEPVDGVESISVAEGKDLCWG